LTDATPGNDCQRARPTVFLDRDGVVNRNRDDYVKCWREFEFLPGSLEALRLLASHGARVIVVTNQSAIGRGIVSREAVDDIHRRMVAEVNAHGGRIEAVLCCPHSPDQGCRCRKPQPGLLLEAMRTFDVNPAASCFVGDSLADLKAAHTAGIPFVMVLTGKRLPLALRQARYSYPRWIAPDLRAAARWFVRRDAWQEEEDAA
jgi:D-glycero-D-manno-heptose 1,7-bisphosphate phosphatase